MGSTITVTVCEVILKYARFRIKTKMTTTSSGDYVDCRFSGDYVDCSFSGDYVDCSFSGDYVDCRFSGD